MTTHAFTCLQYVQRRSRCLTQRRRQRVRQRLERSSHIIVLRQHVSYTSSCHKYMCAVKGDTCLTQRCVHLRMACCVLHGVSYTALCLTRRLATSICCAVKGDTCLTQRYDIICEAAIVLHIVACTFIQQTLIRSV